MGIVNLSNKMDIWFKICEFCSKIFTLTDCCTMSGSSVCFMKNKHRCTMMRYGVLEYIFSFFFFFFYFCERGIWTLFDILSILLTNIIRAWIIWIRLYINETVFLEQNARTTSENYVYITMTGIPWSYDDVIFVKSNR